MSEVDLVKLSYSVLVSSNVGHEGHDHGILALLLSIEHLFAAVVVCFAMIMVCRVESLKPHL